MVVDDLDDADGVHEGGEDAAHEAHGDLDEDVQELAASDSLVPGLPVGGVAPMQGRMPYGTIVLHASCGHPPPGSS